MNRDARPAFEESDPNLVANLRLEVREAYRPGRWMWQIVDARNGMLFEREFEFKYESDARQSGLARLAARLAQLTSSLPGGKIPGRIAGLAPLSRLVIVSQTQNRLYRELRHLLVDSGIDVIQDRRRFDRRGTERRVGVDVHRPIGIYERRKVDRRRSGDDRRSRRADNAGQARGWWIIPRDDFEPRTTRERATA